MIHAVRRWWRRWQAHWCRDCRLWRHGITVADAREDHKLAESIRERYWAHRRREHDHQAPLLNEARP